MSKKKPDPKDWFNGGSLWDWWTRDSVVFEEEIVIEEWFGDWSDRDEGDLREWYSEDDDFEAGGEFLICLGCGNGLDSCTCWMMI